MRRGLSPPFSSLRRSLTLRSFFSFSRRADLVDEFWLLLSALLRRFRVLEISLLGELDAPSTTPWTVRAPEINPTIAFFP